MTITVRATAATDTDTQGNLAANQLLFRLGEFHLGDEPTTQLPVRSAAQLRSLAARVERYAATLDQATVTALQVAVDPALPVEPGERGGPGGRPLVFLGKVDHDAQGHALPLRSPPLVPYLATPAVLQRYGIKPSTVGADTDLLTAPADLQGFEFLNTANGGGLHPKIHTSRDPPSFDLDKSVLQVRGTLRRTGEGSPSALPRQQHPDARWCCRPPRWRRFDATEHARKRSARRPAICGRTWG